MQEKWIKIQENLEKLLDPNIFRIWVAPLHADIEGQLIRLYAPSAFMADWVKRRLLSSIRDAASSVLNLDAMNITIELTVGKIKRVPSAASDILENLLPKTEEQVNLPIKQPALQNCKWNFKFEDLVIGPSNNLAVAAARDLCAQGQVRTLFVNSGPGLGKTHLAQAAGQMLAGSGAIKIAYLTAEQFASRYVASMRAKELEDFKQYLCSLDALLLEDVHFLARKKAMQEMILSVIKNLQTKGARVIFTSSFAPRQLQDMDGQLISHFCSGILAGMDKPDIQMRKEILHRKAKLWQVALPDDVCDVLSNRLSSDVRQLESCLKSMIFKARLLNSGLNVDLALETVNQYACTEIALDLSAIIKLVCESYGITEQQMRSKSRRQEYVHGRNTAFYLARKHTEMSLEEIGCIFNRRHSTVMRGITQVEHEMARESSQGRQFARAVAMIERKCGLID